MPGITGKDGQLKIGGTPVALCYDLNIELNTPLDKCSAKGATFDSYVAGRANGRITGKRRVLTTIALAQLALAAADDDNPVADTVAYVISLNPVGTGTQIMSGNGIFTQGAIAVPYDGLVDDTFELQMTDAPVFTVVT